MGKSITYQHLRTTDLPQVMALGKSTKEFAVSRHSQFWSEAELRRWLRSRRDPLIVAAHKSKVVGFVLAAIHLPTGKATIENLVVSKQYRHRGISSTLLRQCLQQIKKQGGQYVCGLTRPANHPLIQLMRQHGFKKGYQFLWLEKTI